MKNPILAIDLGKYKSVACFYPNPGTNPSITSSAGKEGKPQPRYQTLPTRPDAFHDLIVESAPALVVIEVGNQAGWVKDLCEALEVPIRVANVNQEGWRWKNVKHKTDRKDALKLAKLSVTDQLPTVYLPDSRTRQWRALIVYRRKLVSRQTAIKNSIRAILDRQGLAASYGKSAWSQKGRAWLHAQSRPLVEVGMDELWRGQLALELGALEEVEQMLEEAEAQLDAIGAADARVQRLQTIPGVGPRLSEIVVATIDDPHRFKNRREVGAYAGLAPRVFESGTSRRSGRITGAGQKLLRAMLVEVSWIMKRHNPELFTIFHQVCRGSKTRKKAAIVAMARRLLVICWAMLRDESDWRGRPSDGKMQTT